ncbi:MAG: DUF4118 domain-containing protein [Cyanobacteria bacterium SZAS LIN-3]|nr:DUF4118 domain-containing protein [Cyanobacteria bacterium SZAS LIN-3]
MLAIVVVTFAVALMTGIIACLHLDTSVANISMLYLFVVIGAALTLGRGAAILASLEAFVLFDWCFVRPHQTLIVTDPAEWLSLCMFLVTATVIGQLMVLLVDRIQEREKSRQETAALAEASLAVTSQLDLNKALESVLTQMGKVAELSFARFFVMQDEGRAQIDKVFSAAPGPGKLEGDEEQTQTDIALNFVIEKRASLGMGAESNGALKLPKGSLFLPIIIEDRVLGVLQLQAISDDLQESEKRVIHSLANLAGLVIQRDRLMKVESLTNAVVKTERLKSALLSMVSHDFRSPLTAIKTSVNSLLSDGQPISDETQHSLLLQVDHETDRLNRLIDNILDLSCLEADMISLKCELTPLAELIESALNTLSEAENERISVKLSGESDEVNVDCVLMAQVLRNLLENALKYSPQEAQVELETSVQGDKFFIEVKDRGSGLLASEESLVFAPFFRGSAVKETAIPGMGLGLALSKGLVEAHKGTLSAYNRETGGCVFRITLPLPTVGAEQQGSMQ